MCGYIGDSVFLWGEEKKSITVAVIGRGGLDVFSGDIWERRFGIRI